MLRIAATFGSPRFQTTPSDFYQLLRRIKYLETDGISSLWTVSQDKRSFQASETAGDEHLSEDQAGLTIYVPIDKGVQTICFSSTLPKKLAAWIMGYTRTQVKDYQPPSDAIHALTAILAIDVLHSSVLDKVLDQHGIIQVPIPNQDALDEDNDEESVVDISDNTEPILLNFTSSSTLTVGTNTPRSRTSAETGYEMTTPSLVQDVVVQQTQLYRGRPQSSRQDVTAVATYVPPTHSSPYPVTHTIPANTLEDWHYLKILSNIAAVARRATFPTQGTFNLSSFFNALPSDNGVSDFDAYDGPSVVSRLRSSSQLERDKKIGAAGELYVFVLLDCLLSEWAYENWRSTIRYYCRLHPVFADLTPWIGRGTTDFVFDDTLGEMTDELIENGYLNENEWANARPKYFIEVKTTTGPCATPFYMSKSQFSLMRSKHDSNNYSEVYMILRVYWVNRERIGMRVYLDPEQLRQDEQLLFTGETWSVVPSNGSGS